jgi:hypothetical protein
MDIQNHLKKYLQQPETITSDLLKALFAKNHISKLEYSVLSKRWNKIKHNLDEDHALDPSLTNYQYFMNHNLNGIHGNINFEIGRFNLPKQRQVCINLSCKNKLKDKSIHFFIDDIEVNTFFIETDISSINFNNVKKCIKYCESLYQMNACDRCRVMMTNTNNKYKYCENCRNNSAVIIQNHWRECISNPKYYVCKKRLMNEYYELTL